MVVVVAVVVVVVEVVVVVVSVDVVVGVVVVVTTVVVVGVVASVVVVVEVVLEGPGVEVELVLGAAVVAVTLESSSLLPPRFGRKESRARDRFRILARRPSTFSTSFFSLLTGVASVVETADVVPFGRRRDARLRNLSRRRCAASDNLRRAGELVAGVVVDDVVVEDVVDVVDRGVVLRSTPGGLRRGLSAPTSTALFAASVEELSCPELEVADLGSESGFSVDLDSSADGGWVVFGRGTSSRPGLRLEAILRGTMPISSEADSNVEGVTAVDFSVVVSGSGNLTVGLLSLAGITLKVGVFSQEFTTSSGLSSVWASASD